MSRATETSAAPSPTGGIEWASGALASPRGSIAEGSSVGGAPAKRADIQGLRCVAVVLVIVFHAGWGRLAGGFVGVDVFFVISGFLITGIITRQLSTPGDFSLLGFYANRARRLLPAAFVTIAVTSLLIYWQLPGSRFSSLAHDAMAAAYYGINWRLSNQAVDYLAQQDAPSPFQHFWSLAVEEQFYLVWPLLLLAAALIIRNRARWRRRVYAAGLALVFVPSLIYSITETAANPGQAYFITPTRMWELALGGGLAIFVDYAKRLPTVAAVGLGWAGLAAIAYAALAFDGATPFPGSAALLPTLGAVAVLATGQVAGRRGPAALLNLRPLGFLGDISYSLYLWHWPIIVLVAHHYGDHAPLWAGLLAGFGAILPAYFSYRYIERPVLARGEFANTLSGLRLGFNYSAAAFLTGMLLLSSVPLSHSSLVIGASGAAVDVNGQVVKIGAETLTSDPASGAPRDTFPTISPDPVDAVHDIPDGGRCIALEAQASDLRCTFGVQNSRTTVELVGDSHAMQWLPALLVTANHRGWRVVTHTKQSCPLSTADVAFKGRAYPACREWNAAVMTSVLKDRPALVITSAAHYQAFVRGAAESLDASAPDLISGYRDSWHALTSAGIKVAALADTPRPNFDIVGCVEANRRHLTSCARPRSGMVDPGSALQKAAEADASVTFVDLNRSVCPTSRCAAVIGNVLVYRDSNHITATYATTLGDRFGAAMVPLVAK